MNNNVCVTIKLVKLNIHANFKFDIMLILIEKKIFSGLDYHVEITPTELARDIGNIAQFTCSFNGADAEVVSI